MATRMESITVTKLKNDVDNIISASLGEERKDDETIEINDRYKKSIGNVFTHKRCQLILHTVSAIYILHEYSKVFMFFICF